MNCKRCNKEVPLELNEVTQPFAEKYGVICTECATADEAKEKFMREARDRSNRAAKWNSICPHEFRDNDPKKLPNIHAYKKTEQWIFGKRGLFLSGPTGKGKSRSLYNLLGMQFMAGRKIIVMDEMAGFQYAASYKDGPENAAEWVLDRSEVELLAMDDLFKCKLTESLEQAVFAIVSHRTKWGLPLILTAQDAGASLLSRMSKDRGDALVRRITEFCDVVSFL